MWRDTAKKLMMKKDIHILPPITHESLSSRCTDDSLQPSAPPPSSTIDPDLYNTPEHINQHKRWAKKMSILTGEARLRDRTEDIRSTLPLPVISLLDNGAVYKPDDLQVFQQDELLPTYIFNLSTASGCVRRYASRYLDAVIVFDDIWFLVTSVDVFCTENLQWMIMLTILTLLWTIFHMLGFEPKYSKDMCITNSPS
jgi:hypothetical protein